MPSSTMNLNVRSHNIQQHHSGEIAGVAMAWLLPLIAFANVAAYIAYAGNPLVSSDSWYFINAFLKKAIEVGPSLQDFFVKRGALDHAQPVVKLLLWINARWLGLDYVFEALMGLLFAAATFVVLVMTTRSEARALQPAWLRGLGLGALATTLVTLNSGMVFNWSLVSLIYLSYFQFVLLATAAYRAMRTGRYGWLLASSLLVAFTSDDVGVIISLAIVLTLWFSAARLHRPRAAVVCTLVIVACEAAYFCMSHYFLASSADATPSGGMQHNIQLLWQHHAEFPTMVRIVMGSTFAHFNPLDYFFHGSAVAWQTGFALTALASHAWFWWRALRGPSGMLAFHAIAIMLLFYGLTAGILYGRVPVFGVNYLNEPRYVGVYLLGTVALVLMIMAQPLNKTGRWRSTATVALAAMIVLQIPLSRFTWWESNFLASYYHTMASQMVAMGEHPNPPPVNCIPLLTVCEMQPADRLQAIQFLQRHHLNMYSPAFVERYRLQKLLKPQPASQH